MAFLNWSKATLRQEMTPHAELESLITLTLSMERMRELSQLLDEVLLREGGELRLQLPQEWLIFWKIREGESRLLLAHPEPTEWVTTIALERAHAERVLTALRELTPGQGVRFSALGAVPYPSNVEILIQLE